MDSKNGGLLREEQQRKTAAEIARKKVLAAYSHSQTTPAPTSTVHTNPTPASTARAIPVRQTTATPVSARPAVPASTRSTSPAQTTAVARTVPMSNQIDWQKYHSAWQNYYQKYYGDYYAKAALAFIEKEKMRQARAAADRARNSENALTQSVSSPAQEEKQVVEDSLRARIQQIAKKQKKKRLNRKLIPIAAGVVVVLLLLFLQYNRLIFAPIMAYVSPGNTKDTGISEVDPTVSVAVSQDSRLMIPKLNIDVPVHFGIPNDQVMSAMNNGVAQFSIPGANAMPGQIGNLAISGHSAGDIYSSNQYKFIFSGLERLEKGDLIYIDYQGTRYTYKMVDRKEVDPSDVSSLVLDTDKPMLTLITCWPLGVSTYRLLIISEQINPAPSGESQKEVIDEGESTAEVMPQNEPTFFEGIWNWLTGQ